MNWLAHTLLSRKNIDYQLGNVLADPLRGRAWQDASDALKAGMKMHKSIDKFTDKHALIANSKSRLGQDGHLKGVVLDLLHDHFLSLNWDLYCRWELGFYLERFNHKASKASAAYPDRPQQIVNRMVASNLLGQYQTLEDLLTALQRIDSRLSERTKIKETASQYSDVIVAEYEGLLADFLSFFPQLIDHFKSHRLGSETSHYLL